jgi:hypothetical protein
LGTSTEEINDRTQLTTGGVAQLIISLKDQIANDAHCSEPGRGHPIEPSPANPGQMGKV